MPQGENDLKRGLWKQAKTRVGRTKESRQKREPKVDKRNTTKEGQMRK